MDLIIKKYFWLLPVLVVVVCSALSAKAVNYYIEGKVLAPSDKPPPIPKDLKPDTSAAKAKKSKDSAPLTKRNMFCAECSPPEPLAGEEPTDTAGGGVPITSLPLQLVATMVSDDEQNSFATIRHTDTGGQAGYSFGGEIKGAGEIVSIRGRYVDFRNKSNKRIERVAFGGMPRPKAAVAEVATPTPTGPKSAQSEMMAMIDEGVRKTGENSYEIDRSVVDKVTQNPTVVARGARVVPSIKNGKTQGFKLYAVRPSSVYAKLGLMNGDTLHSINNFELTSLDKGLEIYTKLREANNITINVTRRGKPTTLNYTIK